MNEHIMAFLITISAGAIIAIMTWFLEKRGGLSTAILFAIVISLFPAVYIWIYWRPKVPIADLSFANFNSCAPVTDQGFHWGIFGDYPSGGSSLVKPSIQVDGPSECHLVLQYSLSEDILVSPYCGIYAGFSTRPAIPRNVSSYRGIQIEIGHLGELPRGVLVYIELSPLATIDSYNGYYRYDLTPQIGRGERRLIQASFDEFSPSSQLPKPRVAFTNKLQKEVYQIAIVIVGQTPGTSTQGTIMIDNIQFY